MFCMLVASTVKSKRNRKQEVLRKIEEKSVRWIPPNKQQHKSQCRRQRKSLGESARY